MNAQWYLHTRMVGSDKRTHSTVTCELIQHSQAKPRHPTIHHDNNTIAYYRTTHFQKESLSHNDAQRTFRTNHYRTSHCHNKPPLQNSLSQQTTASHNRLTKETSPGTSSNVSFLDIFGASFLQRRKTPFSMALIGTLS